MSPEPNDVLRARALGDPTRATIYERVCAGPWPVDVATLTAEVGLHHTAVRQHLAKLREAGLVLEATVPSTGRGRPRLGYRPAGPGPRAGDHYRRLATLLAESVRTGDTPREVGRRAGRAAVVPGRRRRAGVGALVREATRLGFQPVLGDGEIVLQACPFADVAALDPTTVCALHLGLAEGLAEAVGGVRVTHLTPRDPHTAGCTLGIAPTSGL